jgi:hypothetical protein
MSTLRQVRDSAGAKKLRMNAFCRADWELPISLSRNFSKLVSSGEPAIDRFELGSFSFIPRTCVWP